MVSLRAVLAGTILVCLLHASLAAPVINTPLGQITGKDAVSPQTGASYSAYLAIPYALPPVGGRRFQKPVPHPGVGQGRVMNATKPGPVCPQPGDQALLSLVNEDCLTLSVYVPVGVSVADSKKVMIWIHGGGFTQGSALEYTPSELVTENDVLVVVIQYRLGILGFLSSGDDVSLGNYGLHDQTLAIKWVKDNIRAFGGEPDSLTIFGESAGAASVGYQVLSPYSKGLFSRAIFQSGTPLSMWAFKKDPRVEFMNLANQTGCLPLMSWSDSAYYAVASGRDREEHLRILDCLRNVDYRRLIPFTSFGVFTTPWVPSVDGDFLPREPEALLEDVNYLLENEILSRDIMVGINNDEGGLVGDLATMLGLELNDELVRELVVDALQYYTSKTEFQGDPARLDTLYSVIEFFYTVTQGNGVKDVQDIFDVAADINFGAPTVMWMRALAEARQGLVNDVTGGSQYLYLFNHFPASKAGSEAVRGMTHAEDLVYQFDLPELRAAFDANDFAVSRTFRAMTTNFAKTGQPQVTAESATGPSSWPEFRAGEEKYLSLGVNPRVEERLYNERLALWTDLIPSLVESTRREVPQSWWQQQQPMCDAGMGNGGPKTFTFKGRLNFFKLQ